MTLAAAGLLAFILARSAGQVVGRPVTDATFDTVRDMMEIYKYLISLVTLAFGAAAFWVTYHIKKAVTPTPIAWAALGAAMASWISAIGLALAGLETLLRMLANDAIDLTLRSLIYARLGVYGFTLLGMLLFGWFAMEVSLAPRVPEARGDD